MKAPHGYCLYVDQIASLVVTEGVYSAVRTESLYAIQVDLHSTLLPSHVSIGFSPISINYLRCFRRTAKRDYY
jgi:hypothetical protein